MATIGLEISDVGLLAAGGSPPSLLKVDGDRSESPGIALQYKKKILVGWEAKRQERLYPRQCTDRFWSLLSTEPMPERGLAVENYAELAVAHLEAVSKTIAIPKPEWALAVPEFLDQGKLGILLGVAKALGLSVQGFVSNAVAAVQPADAGRSTVHVDVHLHRIELTLVEQGERIKRARSYLITDSGWERLEDQVVRRLADEFVQTTRFDPLHEAVAEQNLYDQVAGLIEKATDGQPAPAELKLGKSTYRIAVSARMIAEACDSLRRKVLESLTEIREETRGGNLDVQLSNRAARVPGLLQAIGSADGIDARVLSSGAGALGALAMGAEFAKESGEAGVNYLSSRTHTPSEIPAPPGLPGEGSLPTHVLLGDQAYPLGEDPVYVVQTAAGMDVRSESSLAGENPVCCVQLREGRAVVEPADAAVRLIQVRPAHEA